jgi:peptidyl-prolyl cis-trans isomerase C
MRGKARLGSLLGTLALLVLWAGAQAQGFNPGIAVRVNGVEISNQRFVALYKEYQRSKGVAVGARGDQLDLLMRMRREAMDLMVEQELVRQAAQAKSIEVSDEELETQLAEIREPFEKPEDFARRLEAEGYSADTYPEYVRSMIAAKKYLDEIRMAVSMVSDEELEAYYRDNTHRLTLPEQVRVRHILLTWKPLGKPDDRKALYEQMQPILEKARAGEDFAELARTYSEDSTARDGGDTGLFHRGEMVPAFERTAFSLQPGEISDIVATPYGLHIMRLEERREARLLPLEEIREQLRDHIREEKMEAAVEAEKERLLQAADIEVLIPLERPGS